MTREMRVEQLSTETGVSVDTIRYYQSKGLLDPPRKQGRFAWYHPGHLERISRIRSLQQRGFSLATIVRLLDGDLDAADEALVAELTGSDRPTPTAREVVSGERPPESADRFTLSELAERTGMPLALLKAIEAEGLLVPRRFGTEERYTSEDVAAAEAGLALLEWGVPLSALLDLSRRHHAATEAVAHEAVDLFSTYVRGSLRLQFQDDASCDHEATKLVQAFGELLPAVNTLVGHHFTRTLLRAAFDHIEQVGSDLERRAVWAEATKVVSSAASGPATDLQ